MGENLSSCQSLPIPYSTDCHSPPLTRSTLVYMFSVQKPTLNFSQSYTTPLLYSLIHILLSCTVCHSPSLSCHSLSFTCSPFNKPTLNFFNLTLRQFLTLWFITSFPVLSAILPHLAASPLVYMFSVHKTTFIFFIPGVCRLTLWFMSSFPSHSPKSDIPLYLAPSSLLTVVFFFSFPLPSWSHKP